MINILFEDKITLINNDNKVDYRELYEGGNIVIRRRRRKIRVKRSIYY